MPSSNVGEISEVPSARDQTRSRVIQPAVVNLHPLAWSSCEWSQWRWRVWRISNNVKHLVGIGIAHWAKRQYEMKLWNIIYQVLRVVRDSEMELCSRKGVYIKVMLWDVWCIVLFCIVKLFSAVIKSWVEAKGGFGWQVGFVPGSTLLTWPPHNWERWYVIVVEVEKK